MLDNLGFWKNLKDLERPFIGLSPMDGITDAPFRAITAKYGKPDVIFTEFIAVEALIRGVKRSFDDLRFDEIERPIVAQLYGKDPELFYSCAQIIAELGFDGIDINMGCPAKSVEARGAGAGLIKTPELAVEIIKAVEGGLAGWLKNGMEYDKWPEGIKSAKVRRIFKEKKEKREEKKLIPISIKTRLGYEEPMIEEWFGVLAKTDVSVFSIHGRTLRQKYSGKADWDMIAKVAKYIREINPGAIVIGNGDITSKSQGIKMARKYKVDGVLIGRKSMGNPWVFRDKMLDLNSNQGIEELSEVMLEHSKLHYKMKDPRAFVQMRRILAEYIKNIPNATDIRSKLVRTNNPKEVEAIIQGIGKNVRAIDKKLYH